MLGDLRKFIAVYDLHWQGPRFKDRSLVTIRVAGRPAYVVNSLKKKYGGEPQLLTLSETFSTPDYALDARLAVVKNLSTRYGVVEGHPGVRMLTTTKLFHFKGYIPPPRQDEEDDEDTCSLPVGPTWFWTPDPRELVRMFNWALNRRNNIHCPACGKPLPHEHLPPSFSCQCVWDGDVFLGDCNAEA